MVLTPGWSWHCHGSSSPLAATLGGLDSVRADEYGRTRIELGSPTAEVSGVGTTTIGEREFAWSAGDVIAIPSWHTFSHDVLSEAVLF